MGATSWCRWAIVLGLVGAGAPLGCKPKIGDDCTRSQDCSSAGDRLCDTTQPGGYCTMFNCEPGSCPKEASCIGFGSVVSKVPAPSGAISAWACADPQVPQRTMRTFCMRDCESDRDCRDDEGYVCMDLTEPGNPLGAELIEHNGKAKVCAVPMTALSLPADRATEVCPGTVVEEEETDGDGQDQQDSEEREDETLDEGIAGGNGGDEGSQGSPGGLGGQGGTRAD